MFFNKTLYLSNFDVESLSEDQTDGIKIRVYLDFKKGRTECGPLVKDPEEGKFGVFSTFPRVFVVQRHDRLRHQKHLHVNI